MRKSIVAAVVGISTLLPMGAVASTLSPANTIVNGGSYDMVGAYFFGETFATADVAGTRSFTFSNFDAISQNLELTVATVSALSEKFTGGVTFTWLGSGLSLAVGEAITNFSGSLDNLIAAGASDTLVVAFGDPAIRARRGGLANFTVSLDASPVPLPAGGLLLLGALGGLTALRRRKTV